METRIVTYGDRGRFEKDARRWAKYGWSVKSVAEERPRAGCGRIVALGIFALVFPPKSKWVVVYERKLPGA